MTLKNQLYIQDSYTGFTLIEVLIAIVIMAIGLLGIATMQIVGLKNNQASYYRGQATNLANEFADILRANQTQVRANKFGTPAADGVDYTTATTLTAATSACTTTAGCSTAQMADTVLINWQKKVQTSLRQGIATSERTGNIYTVTIYWADDLTKTVADDAGSGVDVNADGDDIDAVDFDGGGVDGLFEVNFKSFSASFSP